MKGLILREHLILEESHRILDRLGSERLGLQLAVERKLSAIADPEISWRWETAETGFFRALLGKRRDVLVIRQRRFPEHLVVISCRPHGTALHASKLVLVAPRMARDLRRAVRIDADPGTRFEIGAELDLFDVLDLRAFLDIVGLAFTQAIRELTDDMAPDGDELMLGYDERE